MWPTWALMSWPHLLYNLLFSTNPFLFTLLPKILVLLLSANISSLFRPHGYLPCFFSLLRMLFAQPVCMAIPFSSFRFQVNRETYPDHSNTAFLFPPGTPALSFYFYHNTYHSLKCSYLYTCLWPIFPSNMLRAVSAGTTLLPGTENRYHRNLLNEWMTIHETNKFKTVYNVFRYLTRLFEEEVPWVEMEVQKVSWIQYDTWSKSNLRPNTKTNTENLKASDPCRIKQREQNSCNTSKL